LPSLQALLDSEHHVSAVYTQPDRPAGRGRQLRESPVKQLALQAKIPLYQPDRLKELALEADLMVVVAYGLLLPTAVLTAPPYGCINVHASLLPRWRGAAPIVHAILAGDTQSGVTIMQMDAGLDTGDMLNNVSCPIKESDTAQDLHDRLATLGAQALLRSIADIEAGCCKPQKQDEKKASHAGKIVKAQAEINWQEEAAVIARAVRAYHPWPVAFAALDAQHIRIHHAIALSDETASAPGTILQANAQGIDVATRKGVLRILRLQLPGGKVLSAAEILQGHANLFAPGQLFFQIR